MFLVFVLIAVSLLSWMYATPTLGNILYYNLPDYNDYKKFPYKTLKASINPFRFKPTNNHWTPPRSISTGPESRVDFENLLEVSETLAFLVIKDDLILYENYLNGHTWTSTSISFSIAKSFLSVLVGKAIQDGYIQSVDQLVSDFVPELSGKPNAEISIKHLLQMTSGMNYFESRGVHNVFGLHARLYYTPFLKQELLAINFLHPPEQKGFRYKSGESALLGLALSRALQDKTITQYLQESLWNPLGMEFDGLVNLDNNSDGLEKMWCCIGATPRDFAKLGRLYLNKGKWNGKTVIPESWVEQSTRIDESEGSSSEYQYGWWIPPNDSGIFQAEGLFGQYIHVNPKTNSIILRLGKSRGPITREQWVNLFTSISESL